MTTMWLFTFGQWFDYMQGVTHELYLFVTFIAVAFACVVSVTIDDRDIPL